MTLSINSDALKQLIQNRRTCYQFADSKTHPVGDKPLFDCLDAARWAPNHKLTQPWRFWIISHKAQQDLAHVYAEHRALKKVDKSAELYETLYSKALDKFMAIPKIVMVGQVLNKEGPTQAITQKEDYAACACAIQNFQLMAWSLQLGVQWSTGAIIKDLRTYKRIGIDVNHIELIGVLYLGYQKPNCQGLSSKRHALDYFVTYLE